MPSNEMRAGTPWMNTDAAGAYLSVSPRTLAVWRCEGKGPRWHSVGRLVRYHRDDLDAFMRGEDAA